MLKFSTWCTVILLTELTTNNSKMAEENLLSDGEQICDSTSGQREMNTRHIEVKRMERLHGSGTFQLSSRHIIVVNYLTTH